MKQKHWIELAQRATKHDFDIAYGALRFIAREYKPIVVLPCVVDWIASNETRFAALMTAEAKSKK